MHVVVRVTFGLEHVRIWDASAAARPKDSAVTAGFGDCMRKPNCGLMARVSIPSGLEDADAVSNSWMTWEVTVGRY